MPRRNFSDGQEVVLADLNAITPALQRELFDRFFYEIVQRTENAFFADSFLVNFASANSITIKKGSGFQTDNTKTSPEATKRPLYLAADQNMLIDPPNSVNDRIDIVCVASGYAAELTGTRNYKDPISLAVSPQTMTLQKDWVASILIVDGTPGVVPVAPAVPAGYILIAQLYVTAVAGMLNASAITDKRALMPLGGNVVVNTTGAVRLPSAAAVPISTLFASIDQWLTAGYQSYTDFDDVTTDPAKPATSKKRLYIKSGVAYMRANDGSITPLGSGGGGGGGANWQAGQGNGMADSYELNEKVWLMDQGGSDKLVLWVRVPTSYITGRPMTLKGSFYTPGATGAWAVTATSTLIRKNNDAVDSVAHQNVIASGDIVNSVVNQMREVVLLLTSTTGTIAGYSISPGDIVKLELTRTVPSVTEDTNDIRFIPSSTEVLFS